MKDIGPYKKFGNHSFSELRGNSPS